MVQEQFCFDEETTALQLRIMANPLVILTRREPACDEASIEVTLSFNAMGTTLCKFDLIQPLYCGYNLCNSRSMALVLSIKISFCLQILIQLVISVNQL